jgi:hypothetical protein
MFDSRQFLGRKDSILYSHVCMFSFPSLHWVIEERSGLFTRIAHENFSRYSFLYISSVTILCEIRLLSIPYRNLAGHFVSLHKPLSFLSLFWCIVGDIFPLNSVCYKAYCVAFVVILVISFFCLSDIHNLFLFCRVILGGYSRESRKQMGTWEGVHPDIFPLSPFLHFIRQPFLQVLKVYNAMILKGFTIMIVKHIVNLESLFVRAVSKPQSSKYRTGYTPKGRVLSFNLLTLFNQRRGKHESKNN